MSTTETRPYWLSEGTFTAQRRRELAKQGKAMSDGSYPVENLGQLDDAIQAWGRGSGDKGKLKAYLLRRARALNASQAVLDRVNALQEADSSSDEDVAALPAVAQKRYRALKARGLPHEAAMAQCKREMDGRLVEVKSDAYPDLERVPGKQNWVDAAGGLPRYIERIAKHIHYEHGFSISAAIASAVNTVKRWCEGGTVSKTHGPEKGGGVKPDTKAKACAALAEWNAKRAKGKGRKLTEAGERALRKSDDPDRWLSPGVLDSVEALMPIVSPLPADDYRALAEWAGRRMQIAEALLSTLDERGISHKLIEATNLLIDGSADPRRERTVLQLREALEQEVAECGLLREALGYAAHPFQG